MLTIVALGSVTMLLGIVIRSQALALSRLSRSLALCSVLCNVFAVLNRLPIGVEAPFVVSEGPSDNVRLVRSVTRPNASVSGVVGRPQV